MNALVLVDIQNDFLPGGALSVPQGDDVIPVANRLQDHFEHVVATRDWHPADHGSFAANHPGRRQGDLIELGGLSQILWPVHCVQGSQGARFAADLDTERVERIFSKGSDPTIDSYSAFFDNAHRRSTGLGEYLRDLGMVEIFLLGLATDYCVKFTALDGVRLGFKVCVIEDGCRGVDLQRGDSMEAFAEMCRAGVELISSREAVEHRLVEPAMAVSA